MQPAWIQCSFSQIRNDAPVSCRAGTSGDCSSPTLRGDLSPASRGDWSPAWRGELSPACRGEFSDALWGEGQGDGRGDRVIMVCPVPVVTLRGDKGNLVGGKSSFLRGARPPPPTLTPVGLRTGTPSSCST